MSDVSFTVTGRGIIELLAESKSHAWIVQLTKDGAITMLDNGKPVDKFPSSPLTKKLIEATKAVHRDAITYLVKSWEIGRPLDDAEGRELWWKIKKKVEEF